MNDFLDHILHGEGLPVNNPVLALSIVLFIVLLSPLVLKKMNIPGIIGLIISGIIIGKHGFNLIDDSKIELFKTVGLLYIMFIAGLELDMNEFKVNKQKSLVFGLFTFIVPLTIGFPVCKYVLGYGDAASFLTASMFATHTLVAYPIVSRMGIGKNQAVAVAVGGTILTDTAVLIILAVMLSSTTVPVDFMFWIKMGGSLLTFSLFMFLVIPRIAKWFFTKLENEKHSHYIFVLSVVFFSAFLAEVAGVEPIIGAFVAGLALNRLIPHSSTLMNRIEFIGNSLFIPIFLISVGMYVDITVLLNGYMAITIALTLTAVATFGKWLAALFTQLWFKYTATQRQLIFGLSSAHAAATLAIIVEGHKAGILDINILNGTIILILITCIIASFATEKAAKKIQANISDDDSNVGVEGQKNTEKILLPIANINNIDKLMELVNLIKDKKSKTPVTLLSVVPNNQEAELNIKKAKSKLEDVVKNAASSETNIQTLATIDLNVPNGIIRASRELGADIIVVGWQYRKGILNRFMGEKIGVILKNTDKTLFSCELNTPLETLKRIVLVAPELTEREYGFKIWLNKIVKLAQELSAGILLVANERTHLAIQNYLKNTDQNANMDFMPFADWNDFLILSRTITKDDLIFFISARVGSVAHTFQLEQIPQKLEKYFDKNSKIIIYPQQYKSAVTLDMYDDFDADSLNRGINTVQRIGKGIGTIFKRDEK